MLDEKQVSQFKVKKKGACFKKQYAPAPELLTILVVALIDICPAECPGKKRTTGDLSLHHKQNVT